MKQFASLPEAEIFPRLNLAIISPSRMFPEIDWNDGSEQLLTACFIIDGTPTITLNIGQLKTLHLATTQEQKESDKIYMALLSEPSHWAWQDDRNFLAYYPRHRDDITDKVRMSIGFFIGIITRGIDGQQTPTAKESQQDLWQ